jgi:hypothetical protein
MNSLFNPYYFGDVKINATLVSPPQTPSDISVTKQGEDILLTWTDPTLGLSGDPTVHLSDQSAIQWELLLVKTQR